MFTNVAKPIRPTLLAAGLFGLLCAHAAAAPTITSFNPTYGSPGDPNYVHIYGSGFSPGTLVVKFNNTQAAASAPSSGVIEALVPAGAPLGSGPIYVAVVAAGVTNSTYSLNDFTVIGPGPYISSFSPTVGAAGATVTINGARFTYPLTVKFNGQSVTVPSGAYDTTFDVTVPAGVTTGPISVTTTGTGGGTTTTVSNFYAPPMITGFSPTNGQPGTNVVLTGTNFVGAFEVRFGGVLAPGFTVLSNNALRVAVPVGATNSLIWVKAPQGQVNTENLSVKNFTVLPTISGFNPPFGEVGDFITITGANLNEGSGSNGVPVVRFNGVASSSVSGVTFSQLTAQVPAGAATGLISVTTTNGSATNASLFYLPPRITGFTPATNPPGSRITITGTNFTGAAAVTFYNGRTSPNITITNDNVIGAEVPVGIVTGPISITGPAGTRSSASNYFAAPVISHFLPPGGLPGSIVSIYGTSFQNFSAVRFTAIGGYVNAPIYSWNYALGYISVIVPTNGITGPVTVIAPAGSATSLDSFYYNYSTLALGVTDSPDPVDFGNHLTYTIQVQNLGPGSSGSVTLTNVLPAGTTFIGSSAGTTNSSGLFTANLGTLGMNSTTNLTLTVRPDVSGISITNLTIVTGGLNPVPATALTPTYVLPKLTISATAPSLFDLTWPLTPSNYVLQYTPDLGAGDAWSNEPSPPATNGVMLKVTVTNNQTFRFYRLHP